MRYLFRIFFIFCFFNFLPRILHSEKGETPIKLSKQDAAQIKQLQKAGVNKYNSGNYKEAMDLFLQVLAIDPKNEKAKEYIEKAGDKMLEPERKAIEKERAQLMEDARQAFKEYQKQQAKQDKLIKLLFKSAKNAHDKKRFLKATDKFKEIILQYPDYDLARKYYEKISSDMNATAKELQTTDLEGLSYANGYVSYYDQKLTDAVNEWEKVLHINPNRDELNEYILKVNNYLKDTEKLAKEKETEERIKQLFAEGVYSFDNKNWIPCIKKMENVQNICRTDPFPRSLEWYNKAREYIVKTIEELSKVTPKPIAPVLVEKPEEVEIDIAGANKKYTEGLILYVQGKLFDAVKVWEIAIRLNPNHEKAQRALEKAKKELGLLKK
ncbi:MAG: hypothetical protein WC947_08580 [Elusimicrobiota bacterium]